MKWKLLLLLTALMIIPAVNAQERPICTDVIAVGENCTFVTPTLDCAAFDYDVLNLSGFKVLANSPLSLLNNSIYQFDWNLTLEENDYVIELCDGTTREVEVIAGGREGRNVGFIAIAVIMTAVMGLLGWTSLNLAKIVRGENEEDGKYAPLRVLFFIITMIIAVAGINISRIIAIDRNLGASIVGTFETLYIISIGGLIFVGAIALIYYLVTLIRFLKLGRSTGGGGRFDR